MRFEGAGDESVVRVVYSFPAGKGGGVVGKMRGQQQQQQQGGKEGEVEREASFEVKVPESGSLGYEVVSMRPRLEREKVDKVVGRLNETREIGVLLKGMRALFAEEMK